MSCADRDEGGRMKDEEKRLRSIHPSAFILQLSSFILIECPTTNVAADAELALEAQCPL